ncbi:hypothetical protein [Larkinella rosea]|nr:hypothetical protein [Larkinella rosea]
MVRSAMLVFGFQFAVFSAFEWLCTNHNKSVRESTEALGLI